MNNQIFIDNAFELKVKKSKGSEKCQVNISGREDLVLYGLGQILETLVNEIEIDKSNIENVFNNVLHNNKSKEITVQKIHVNDEQAKELENILRKITNGGNK